MSSEWKYYISLHHLAVHAKPSGISILSPVLFWPSLYSPLLNFFHLLVSPPLLVSFMKVMADSIQIYILTQYPFPLYFHLHHYVNCLAWIISILCLYCHMSMPEVVYCCFTKPYIALLQCFTVITFCVFNEKAHVYQVFSLTACCASKLYVHSYLCFPSYYYGGQVVCEKKLHVSSLHQVLFLYTF